MCCSTEGTCLYPFWFPSEEEKEATYARMREDRARYDALPYEVRQRDRMEAQRITDEANLRFPVA